MSSSSLMRVSLKSCCLLLQDLCCLLLQDLCCLLLQDLCCLLLQDLCCLLLQDLLQSQSQESVWGLGLQVRPPRVSRTPSWQRHLWGGHPIIACICRSMMMMPFNCSYRNKNEPSAIYPSFWYSPERYVTNNGAAPQKASES
jgi:hypothetical protein